MEQHKFDLINYRIEKAKETADEADLALSHNKLRLAENRIYYAIFYIVHALSIVTNFSTSKHTTLKGWFNKEFIFTGKIDQKFYKIYNRAFDKRQEGDYDDFITFEKAEVTEDLQSMKHFLKEMEGYINKTIEEMSKSEDDQSPVNNER